MEVVEARFVAQFLQRSPMTVGNAEPFGISRTDVDVDGAKVVVLLMPRRPSAWDFHVELDSIHS